MLNVENVWDIIVRGVSSEKKALGKARQSKIRSGNAAINCYHTISTRASQDHKGNGNLTFVGHPVHRVSVGNPDNRLVHFLPDTSGPSRCCIGLVAPVQQPKGHIQWEGGVVERQEDR